MSLPTKQEFMANSLIPVEATEDCAICLDVPTEPVQTPCPDNLIYCRACIIRCLKTSTRCTVCKKELYLPDNLVEAAVRFLFSASAPALETFGLPDEDGILRRIGERRWRRIREYSSEEDDSLPSDYVDAVVLAETIELVQAGNIVLVTATTRHGRPYSDHELSDLRTVIQGLYDAFVNLGWVWDTREEYENVLLSAVGLLGVQQHPSPRFVGLSRDLDTVRRWLAATPFGRDVAWIIRLVMFTRTTWHRGGDEAAERAAARAADRDFLARLPDFISASE